MQRFPFMVIALLGTPLAAFSPPLLAWAGAPGRASVVADDASPQAKKGATIDGTVATVDYAGNTFVIDVPGKGKVTVIVKPSTDFEGSPGYHSITDIVKGANVSVLSSVVGEKTFAEIVTLKAPPAHAQH